MIERVLIRPVEGRSPLNVVIVTLGMFLAINSLAQLFFGTDPQQMAPWPSGRVNVFSTDIRNSTIALIVVLARSSASSFGCSSRRRRSD